MRTKKGEKWYGGIVFCIWVGLIIWIVTWDRGFVFTNKKTGKTTEGSYLYSAFIVFLEATIFPLGIGLMLRFWLLKTNDFVCKYCKKEYGGSFETEKEVCKTCYEKRRNRF